MIQVVMRQLYVIPGNKTKYRHGLRNAMVIPELKFSKNHSFDFDMSDPKSWFHFLNNYIIKEENIMVAKNDRHQRVINSYTIKKGYPLPRFSKQGLPIRYTVQRIGGVKSGKGKTRDFFKVLFPGYTEEGDIKDSKIYGILDPIIRRRLD